jgi:hypothetical protein
MSGSDIIITVGDVISLLNTIQTSGPSILINPILHEKESMIDEYIYDSHSATCKSNSRSA